MQVYVQKSMRTIFPRRADVVSGGELSHSLARSTEANSVGLEFACAPGLRLGSTLVAPAATVAARSSRPQGQSDIAHIASSCVVPIHSDATDHISRIPLPATGEHEQPAGDDAHSGSGLPVCSLTMYSAYQSGQPASCWPVRFSCSP